MKRGTKPKPAVLKIIEGNPGKRAIKEGVKTPPVAPTQPDWKTVFTGTAKGIGQLREDAKDEWERIVPVLDHIGLLSTIDSTLLIDYCVCWARLLECEREISRDGLTLETERGWVKHPCTTVGSGYRTQMKFYIGELGLSPSSRGRLELPNGGSRGGDDDLLD